VDVAIDGQQVTVKGPKGTLSHTVADPITIERGDDGVAAGREARGVPLPEEAPNAARDTVSGGELPLAGAVVRDDPELRFSGPIRFEKDPGGRG